MLTDQEILNIKTRYEHWLDCPLELWKLLADREELLTRIEKLRAAMEPFAEINIAERDDPDDPYFVAVPVLRSEITAAADALRETEVKP